MKIRIIGYGRLAKSLISTWQKKHSIIVSAPSLEKKTVDSNFQTTNNNLDELASSKIIILAVKPAIIETILKEISPHLSQNSLLISLAAAIELKILQRHCPCSTVITRVMPNIASEVGASATLALRQPLLTSEDEKIIEQLFLDCGRLEWVEDETFLDLGTIIAGSGPAFVFYFMEALKEGMINLGLPANLVNKLVYQTLSGSLKLVKNKMSDLNQKIEQVCSPKGVTAQALEIFEKEHFKETIQTALNAALVKINELKQ